MHTTKPAQVYHLFKDGEGHMHVVDADAPRPQGAEDLGVWQPPSLPTSSPVLADSLLTWHAKLQTLGLPAASLPLCTLALAATGLALLVVRLRRPLGQLAVMAWLLLVSTTTASLWLSHHPQTQKRLALALQAPSIWLKAHQNRLAP